MADDLLDEIVLGDARGGRRPAKPLHVEVVRELTMEDLEEMAGSPPASQQTGLGAIRYAHHQLARLLAAGTDQNEVALVTGYSPAYISKLKSDPAFKELLEHYAVERQEMFVDALERMKSLGLNTLEELQQRLEEDPAGWSRRELMDLAKLTLLDSRTPGAPAGSGASGGSGVSISVSFVAPQAPALPKSEGSEMIDVTPKMGIPSESLE